MFQLAVVSALDVSSQLTSLKAGIAQNLREIHRLLVHVEGQALRVKRLQNL